jgi:hypothetical protein
MNGWICFSRKTGSTSMSQAVDLREPKASDISFDGNITGRFTDGCSPGLSGLLNGAVE